MTWIHSIIDSLYGFSDWGTDFVIVTTVSALLLTAVVLAINVLAHRWVTAAQMSLLWGLVLVRLLLPAGPGSSFSLQNLLATAEQQNVQASPPTIETWIGQPSSSETKRATAELGQPHPQPAASGEPEIPWEVLLGYSLLVLWPCGALFVLLSSIVTNWRFSRRVRRMPLCHDRRLLELWQQSSAIAAVRREIPIVVLDRVRQPSIMGALHPCLLLPPDVLQLTDQQLKMIMLHELAHVRRLDVLVNWALLVVRAVHWWNPVCWLALSRYCSLREQACDAFVIRRLSADARPGYGELLIELAARSVGQGFWRLRLPASILSIFSSLRRRPIASRLRALPAAATKRSRVQILAVAATILLTAYCGLTSAKSDLPSADTAPTQSIWSTALEQSEFEAEAQPTNIADDANQVTAEYDLDPVLDGIAGEDLSRDEALLQLKSLLNMQMSAQSQAATKQAIAPWPAQQPAPVNVPAAPAPHFEIDGKTLSVTTTARRQAGLAKMMKVWKQSGLTQIAVECRFITKLPAGLAIPLRYAAPPTLDDDELLPPADNAGQAKLRVSARMEYVIPVVYAVLPPEKAGALIDAAQNSTRANVLQSPNVTCFNGQLVMIADVSQRPFVTGIREQTPGVLTPKISIASEGTKVQLRPIVSGDRKSVQLTSRIAISGINDVQLARIKTSISEAEPTEVQVPHVQHYIIDISSEIPDGHSLLLALLSERGAQQMTYLLLTPRVLAEESS